MTPEDVNRIADRLLEARREHRQISLPVDDTPPPGRDIAFAIQDRVTAALGPVGGWKVGADNAAATPTAAPLPASLVVRSGTRFPAGSFKGLGLEAEIAFRLATDLPARERPYSREEIVAAIESVKPVIEIVDSRWAGWPRVDKSWQLADHQSNGALVYGVGKPDWHGIDFAIQPAKLTVNDRIVAETLGCERAGDLFRLVTWLANHATARTGGLKAGQIITTGSCTGLSFANPGARIRASFPGIGEVETLIEAG